MDEEKLERRERDFWESERETRGESLKVQGVTKKPPYILKPQFIC